MSARNLPYAPEDTAALCVFAATPRASASAEAPAWHAIADFAVLDNGCWSIRVRDLFDGNRWSAWQTVRRPKRTCVAEGWTATQVRDARRCLRAECGA